MPKAIIIDTDPGIDDAMAILMALNSPELDVAGLTATYGNVHTRLAAQNALRLVEFAGRREVPVAAGAERPLVKPLLGVADFVHGADGLGNVNLPPPAGRPLDIPAARFIAETVMARPGEITLVAVGPLTNLALALALEPRLAANVAGVVVMGGAVAVSGNVTPAGEANIIQDPHAADAVFGAGWPLTMVGLDVTAPAVMSDASLAGLAAAGSRLGEFVYRISRFYLEFHRSDYGLDGLQTHDPSAIAYLLDPGLFTTVRGPIRVVTEGLAMGQTLLDRHGHWRQPNAWTGRPEVEVCVGVDVPGLLDLCYERLGG